MSEQSLVDVAADDDGTALAFQQLLVEWWAMATAGRTTLDVCGPIVRLRCYMDLRQRIILAATDEAPAPRYAEIDFVGGGPGGVTT
ncbi:DUF6207 family protein [Streptomyces cadmiisoli]|uniref:DUF6207 family protein n=1 Tax=Streptomyces cadmiisoli TaxID=2184053 RepID=UPI00364B3B90